jgi:hypothetical protein
MSLIMRTAAPESNPAGTKRWFLGDLNNGRQKVFLYESTSVSRQQTGCARYSVRTYDHRGELLTQQCFRHRRNVDRHICRRFHVSSVELGEEQPALLKAA